MTIDEFLKKLKSTLSQPGYTPYYDDHKQLRILDTTDPERCYCPLTLVYHSIYNEFVSEMRWDYAAFILEISYKDAMKIIFAADRPRSLFRQKLVNILFPERTTS